MLKACCAKAQEEQQLSAQVMMLWKDSASSYSVLVADTRLLVSPVSLTGHLSVL